MPGGFPFGADLCNGSSAGVVIGNNLGGTVLTASATLNTKGAWTQISASTPSDACAVGIMVSAANSTNSDGTNTAIDIGIGASGSEVVLIANLVVPRIASSQILVPLSIPAGTRVAMRCQATKASDVTNGYLQLFDGAMTQMEGCAGADTIGFVSASTQGTLVTFAAGAKGSYSQITSATTRDYLGFMLAFDTQGASSQFSSFTGDLAIGSSGSEKIILPDLFVDATRSAVFNNMLSNFYPIAIPAGTRIAARGQSVSYATANVGVTFYGFYA